MAAVAIALLVVALSACSGDGGGVGGGNGGGGARPAVATSPPTTDEAVAAAVLAAMDERQGSIGEYRDLLGTLQSKCSQLPNRIADYAVDAQRRMADHGLKASMITTLQAMVAAVPPGDGPADCAAVAVDVARRLAP